MSRSGQKNIRKTNVKSKAKKKNTRQMPSIFFEIIGLVMLGVAALMAFQTGKVGRMLYNSAEFMVGYLAFGIPVALVALAVFIMVKRNWPKPRMKTTVGSAFILTGTLLFCHLIWASRSILPMTSSNVWLYTKRDTLVSGSIFESFTATGGGLIGAQLYALTHFLFDTIGTWIVSIILLSIGAIILTGRTLAPFIAEKIPSIQPVIKSISKRFTGKKKKQKKVGNKTVVEPPSSGFIEDNEPVAAENSYDFETESVYMDVPEEPIISAFTENVKPKAQPVKEKKASAEDTEEDATSGDVQLMTTAEELENEEYQLPPMELLTLPPHSDQSGEYAGIQKNAKKLEKTFQSFGVRAKVTQVHLGPAVTKYEVLPDTGVKVSKIVSLHDDLALALAARDIRIEAPIPGKSAIGIEVPNSSVAIVSLREVLESEENNKPDSKLLFGLGRDVTGQAVMTELNKMPHLLVAGSTGSGKSVCINGIITSIIMRAKPHEVKMMMIDPKMVELNVYNGIPHLLAPVVTDPRKAAQALKKIVSEMERRYELFSHTGTRNIEGYNEYVRVFNEENEEKHPKLPFIVVIVDELADLMMVASNEVEDAITRLAQMARAAGIHLIIATQRPSVNVITGVIKANIPSRIAFAVSSAIDSRTILDMGGAEKLLGRGDMLFLGAGQSKPVRVQGAFLSDSEVEKIVDFAIEQQKAQYQEDMIPTEVEESSMDEETDEIYDEAVQLVTEMQTASVSMLQRRFRVGYSRAARIIDQMEQRGVVGPYEGSKPRTVLVQKQEEY
ncbi:FtsK/SpoIIIE family DNA translocase [Planococcus sp. CAU13]|uniref:FtsK/SpoIIIE family DNA translocase n=1 Tax=Planococcus sp. CAU13 TaxID=1541197 RepID=UPI00053007E7|nr:DNA translocase FtsK [Planococcus sp. CAU13]